MRGFELAAALLVSASAILAGIGTAVAQTWAVDRDNSRIAFSGTHAGNSFSGEFKTWRADIQFDPAKLDAARVDVRVDLTSAATGDVTYDKTLPTSDWFDTRRAAEGRFVADNFEAVSETDFKANGTLSIRGFDVPVTLDFTFAREGEAATVKGRTTLKRLDFAIGKGSDATGGWVSLDIPVTVDVRLVPVGAAGGATKT